MTFGKRQLVIAAMVVALGAAVYLNWQFSGIEPVSVTSSEESSSKQLGQTTYVNTELKNEEESKKAELTDKTKAVNADESKIKSGRFSDERAKRTASNTEATEALTDILESASSSEAAKKDVVTAAERLAKIIKAEGDIENEIRLKGFEDAFVSVNNGSCSVYVYNGKLNDSTAIVIKDIVNRQLGTAYEKITVAETK